MFYVIHFIYFLQELFDMQESVSLIYYTTVVNIGFTRVLDRGGGNPPMTAMIGYSSATSCTSLCTFWQGAGLLDSYAGASVFYGKCFNSSAIIPPNRNLIQFSSQLGTFEIDPALPAINTANKTKCLRMFRKSMVSLKVRAYLVDFLKIQSVRVNARFQDCRSMTC